MSDWRDPRWADDMFIGYAREAYEDRIYKGAPQDIGHRFTRGTPLVIWHVPAPWYVRLWRRLAFWRPGAREELS